MMTENKRFKVKDGFDHENKPCKLIEDTQTTEQYDTSNELEANSLCKLLNQQEELISEQAIQLDYLKDENQHMKDVLNENKQLKELGDYQADKIKELQERNDRQYDILTHLWTCIENKDWETLTKEWEELEEANKKLQEEWKCL